MGDAHFHRYKANTHIERAYQELTSAVIELTEAGDHASAELLRSARDVTDAIAHQTVAAASADQEARP